MKVLNMRKYFCTTQLYNTRHMEWDPPHGSHLMCLILCTNHNSINIYLNEKKEIYIYVPQWLNLTKERQKIEKSLLHNKIVHNQIYEWDHAWTHTSDCACIIAPKIQVGVVATSKVSQKKQKKVGLWPWTF